MTIEGQMSVSGYARHLGLSKRAVQKAIESGKIEKGYDLSTKKIIVAIADKEYGNGAKVNRPKAGVSKQKVAEKMDTKTATKAATSSSSRVAAEKKKIDPEALAEAATVEGLQLEDIRINQGMSYDKLLQAEQLIDTLMKKNKLRQQQGELVNRSEVDKEMFAYGREIRNNMLAIPDRVIDLVLAAPTKVEAITILKKEISGTLMKFSEEESK